MNICIAGYPRSGTNWLQRLVAYSLNGRVPEYHLVENNDSEPNRTINEFIENQNKSIGIYRTHVCAKNLKSSFIY